MRSSSFLACCLVLLACGLLLVAAAPHARHSHSHAHRRPSAAAAAAPAAVKPSAAQLANGNPGTKLDWKASVYQGVDRAHHVDANAPTQVKLAFIPVSQPADSGQHGAADLLIRVSRAVCDIQSASCPC